MDKETLKKLLRKHEGLRHSPYRDIVGKLTIGYGHNLDAKPISTRACEVILEDDIEDVLAELKLRLPWVFDLDNVRLAVLTDLAFNIGVGGLLAFKKMLAAVREQRYDDAVVEMLDSKWAKQVQKDRVDTLTKMLATGEEA